MLDKTITREFNDIGEKITIEIQLKYEDLEVSKYPEDCVHCPVGFMYNRCGRDKELSVGNRAEFCKLTLVDI